MGPSQRYLPLSYHSIQRYIWLNEVFELQWQERLLALCAVSETEPYSTSYYWGVDVDGEPDTLWGLEGYSHPIGFFLGHTSTDVFKEEMRKVDEDNLLRNVQGLGSPDYDLHHYDTYSGFLKRPDDKSGDVKDSFVVVVHFWALDGKRKQLFGALADYADRVKASEKAPAITVQSFGVLKELRDLKLASLYIRSVNIFLCFHCICAIVTSFLGRGPGATGKNFSLQVSLKSSSRISNL